MPIISDCPQCGGKVSVPTGIEGEATVRCPLCAHEFPLSEALLRAADAPPALVPVSPTAEDPSDGLSLDPSEGLSLADDAPGQEPEEADEETYRVAGETDGAAAAEHYDFASAAPGALGTARPWRNRQPEPSPVAGLVKFIGMGIFGLLGIAVAYLALSLISPKNFDYLNLWGKRPAEAPSQPGSNGRSPSTRVEPDGKEKWPGLN